MFNLFKNHFQIPREGPRPPPHVGCWGNATSRFPGLKGQLVKMQGGGLSPTFLAVSLADAFLVKVLSVGSALPFPSWLRTWSCFLLDEPSRALPRQDAFFPALC